MASGKDGLGVLLKRLSWSLFGGKAIEYRGLKVPVSKDHVPFPVIKQILRNRYEAPEIDGIAALIRPGDRILELGTGLGIVSALASRMAEGVEIRTFEANPSLLPHISALHARNGIGNIVVENAMLEPDPQVATRAFHIHEFFPEGSVIETGRTAQTVDIPVRDLNAVLADFVPQILVCDIEGAEAQILPGARLDGLRGLVLELHPKVLERAQIAAIYDACAKAGLYPMIEHSGEQVVTFEKV